MQIKTNKSVWSFLNVSTNKLLLFALELIYTFWIGKDDLKIVVFIIAYLLICETLIETGIQSFLVQYKGDINNFLNTAWSIEIIKGVLLCIITIMFSFICEKLFFINANYYLLLISPIFIIRCSKNSGIALIKRDINTKKLFYIEAIPVIFQFILACIFIRKFSGIEFVIILIYRASAL